MGPPAALTVEGERRKKVEVVEPRGLLAREVGERRDRQLEIRGRGQRRLTQEPVLAEHPVAVAQLGHVDVAPVVSKRVRKQRMAERPALGARRRLGETPMGDDGHTDLGPAVPVDADGEP